MKKRTLTTPILLLPFMCLVSTLILGEFRQSTRDFRSYAANAPFEVENGTIVLPAQKIADTRAANGFYVQFGSLSPTLVPTVPSTAELPSQILDLTNWKETLPTGSSGSPTEIKQPVLATFKLDPWFVVAPDHTGVRFRAPVNGVTTSGSSYPRSELREMSNNGSVNAAWSSTTGTHTMFLEEAITAVPQTKKHVVAGQIHDASNDVIVIRLEFPKLFIDINGTDGPTLDANYVLGKRFSVKFVANGGKTNIFYNGSPTSTYTLTKNYSSAYFKAGAYTQSNCSTEAQGLCQGNNYGEVIIYQATVTHQ